MKNLNALLFSLFSLAFAYADNAAPSQNAKDINLADYQLIFADEFEGNTLNWDKWLSDKPTNIKRATSRGPEAVEVKDGELRMNIRKVDRGKVQWLACYVYLKEPLENNSYVECRFKSGAASGVNNAFWLASKTPPNNENMNRYEIDIVETRKDISSGKGKAHLAWHDWKTYSYLKDSKGAKVDIAQGISVEHSWEEYHVWGLWYGENELIYYLDGKEIWRGTTHAKYKDQYNTALGKVADWNPTQNPSIYGNYGQEDWSYLGGYNGDKMHVILSNLPWEGANTPLIESEADGTYMAVDYLRIYKPKSLLNAKPDTDVSAPLANMKLSKPYSLAENANYYFSLTITKQAQEALEIKLLEANGKPVGKIIIDKDGYLIAGMDKLVSSKLAASAFKDMKIVEDNKPTLLVCRITAKANSDKYDKDAISVWACPIENSSAAKEPYFYPNINEDGGTSLTQGWFVNQKSYSSKVIGAVAISSSKGADLSSFGRLRTGRNFLSVIK